MSRISNTPNGIQKENKAANISKPGLCIIPEEAHPKFYTQHRYPYYLVKKNAKDKVILDIGSGDGHGSFYLSEVAKEVIGIDCEGENVEHAQNKYKRDNLKFKFMSGTNLTFQKETFDIACSFQVIEHIKEDMLLKYLSEIFRVLKPAGTFYVSTLNKDISMKPGQPYNKNPYHEKEFNAIELKKLLLKVFPKVEMYGVYPAAKHRFFQRLKKIGIFKPFPKCINPVERFYKNITFQDFQISKNNLKESLDLICICYRKPEGVK